jgi:hypothetical protein
MVSSVTRRYKNVEKKSGKMKENGRYMYYNYEVGNILGPENFFSPRLVGNISGKTFYVGQFMEISHAPSPQKTVPPPLVSRP